MYFSFHRVFKADLEMHYVNKGDPVCVAYLTPGPGGDGCLPGRGTEPGQHRQVPEQPQNHGPRHQAECQIWSFTTAIDKKGPKLRGEENRFVVKQSGEPQRFSTIIPLCADQTGEWVTG